MLRELIKLLIDKKLTIATAESCTGGMIAKMLTDVAGASACFGLGVVSYSNEAKTSVLGVPSELIEEHGAVSREVALAMSQGIRRVSRADIALSVTGISGPSGGTKEKPVGLVYISLCAQDRHICEQQHFSGTRDEIRRQTADRAIGMATEYIESAD